MTDFKVEPLDKDRTKPIELQPSDYALYQAIQDLVSAINKLTTVMNK